MASHEHAHESHENPNVPHPHHPDTLGIYLMVFAALMILLVITVWVAFHHFGIFNPIIALSIAFTKAALVIWFFMHVRHATQLTWVFATGGFFFLALLIIFVISDVGTRNWLGVTEMEQLPGPFETLMQEEKPYFGESDSVYGPSPTPQGP